MAPQCASHVVVIGHVLPQPVTAQHQAVPYRQLGSADIERRQGAEAGAQAGGHAALRESMVSGVLNETAALVPVQAAIAKVRPGGFVQIQVQQEASGARVRSDTQIRLAPHASANPLMRRSNDFVEQFGSSGPRIGIEHLVGHVHGGLRSERTVVMTAQPVGQDDEAGLVMPQDDYAILLLFAAANVLTKGSLVLVLDAHGRAIILKSPTTTREVNTGMKEKPGNWRRRAQGKIEGAQHWIREIPGNWWRYTRESIEGWLHPIRKGAGNWWRLARSRIEYTRRWLKQRTDTQVWFALALALIGLGVVWIAGPRYGGWGEIRQGVYVEGTGALMDLVVFGVIIAIMVRQRERKQKISSQLELIDDFKKWDSEEGRYRIAGAVRRLNRLGRTSIDFVGMEMSEFSFPAQDIDSIAGSRFYLGTWGPESSDARAVLTKVNFSRVDCSNVIFSAYQPLGIFIPERRRNAQILDCRFEEADLRGATFNGALMQWTDAPPEETGYWEEMQDGERSWVPNYRPPFWMADLKGASFENVWFRNADFRDAVNLKECNFAGATGLDDCIFDSEEVKRSVLRSAQRL